MPRNRFIFKWSFVAAILLALSITGCSVLKRSGSNSSSSSSTMQTAILQRGNLIAVIGATGSVRSKQYATVNWQTGGKVGEVNVKLGQVVQADEVLASLDTNTLSQNIIQAQADLIDAKTALEDLKKPQPFKIAQAETALVAAQSELENLLNPSSLTIAQAEATLTNTQTALNDLLNPSQLAITQAETAVINAQSAVDDAQNVVDRLKYARGSKDSIDAAQAAYLLAQEKVDKMQEFYETVPGSPGSNSDKAQALTNLANAEAARDRALATLNWLKGTPSEAEIAEKNTALALAQAQLAEAQQTLDNLKNPSAADIELAKAHVADVQEALDKLKNPQPTDIALAKEKVADAQETLDTAKNGATADELTIAEGRVVLAQNALNQAKLTAPFAGTITSVQTMPGDIVSSGKAAFRIDDLSVLYVDLQVSEIDIQTIQVGQPVSITFDAIPDQGYSGIVTDIGLVGTSSSGVVNFPVTVQLTNADSSVKFGMTVVANVIIAEVDNVLQVPNRAVQTSGDQKFVYVWSQDQNSYVAVQVKVGLASDTMTEVSSDQLKEGAEILVSVPTTSTNSDNFRPGGMIGIGGIGR